MDCQFHLLFHGCMILVHMFPDNKHDIQQISIGALKDTEIVFVVELVHGLYYDSLLKLFMVLVLSICSPHRSIFSKECIEPCKYTGKSPWAVDNVEWGGENFDRRHDTRRTGKLSQGDIRRLYYPFISCHFDVNDFDGQLFAPLNLPLDDDNEDKFNLEQTVLIDRIADWWVGDPLYEPAVFNGPTNETQYSPTLITGDEPVNASLDGKVERLNGFLQRFAKRDSLLVRAVDSTWWVKAEGDRVDVLALPYLPFFPRCRNYNNHVIYQNY